MSHERLRCFFDSWKSYIKFTTIGEKNSEIMAVLLALAELIHLKDILYFPLLKGVKRFEAALMLAPEQSTQVQ